MLSALSADLTYDPAQVEVLSCEIAEAGACNDVGGTVKFSLFRVTGIESNEQVATVSFMPIRGTSGPATFTLRVGTAVDEAGFDIAAIAVAPITVDLAQTHEEPGSLTGDVTDGATSSGLFGAEVCAVRIGSEVPPSSTGGAASCTQSNGWGAWRIDELAPGDYSITVRHPNDHSVTSTFEATVSASTVATGLDVSLARGDAPSPSEPTGGPVAAPIDLPAQPAVYGSSITGTIRAMADGQPVEAIQVSATQTFELHQSCGSTNSAGQFVLDGVTTGNYWISTVDPLSRYQDARPALVGVVGDTVIQRSATMWLVEN